MEPTPEPGPNPPPQDRRDYPHRPWVGVGVVVRSGERVLLVRRGRPPRLGEWGIPGGAQRLGETVFAAAIREVAEETGLLVRPLAILDVVDSITTDPDGRVRFHYTLVEVLAEAAADEPQAADDADAAAWASWPEVERRVAWDETRRIIRMGLDSRA